MGVGTRVSRDARDAGKGGVDGAGGPRVREGTSGCDWSRTRGGTVWDSLFTVVGVGEGGRRTRLELVMEARPYRLMARLLVPLMRRVVAKAVEGDMDAVKGWCEGG